MTANRVWIINQFAGNPESGWGERHFYFASYWKKMGIEPVIISGSYNHMFNNLPETKGMFTEEVYDGIRFCWVKTPKYNPKSVMRFWSMLVFMWRILKIPASIYGKPDAIVVSSMPIFPILTASWLKNRYKSRKLIFEIRDIWPLSLIYLAGVGAGHPLVRFIGWFEKRAYRKSDDVVSLLPNARAHIEEVAGKKVNFHYIPNGLSEELLKEEELPAEIESMIPKDKFIIGYTGTMGLANALEHFVEAANRIEDDHIHFVMVGDGYLKKDLIEMNKEKGNITFVPKIRKNQVQAMLMHFDVCFVGRNGSPLFEHGVSANKYFDYMLAAKPILDSNNLIKDPVELSGCGIIVKPDSSEEIYQGILRMYSLTKEERQEMGEKGRKFLQENHQIKHLAEQYARIF